MYREKESGMTGQAISEMIKLYGSDTRRINHSLKVLGFARCIADSEGLTDNMKDVVELAAVLHDIAIRHCEQKYGSCEGKLQEREGPAIALPVLERCGASPTISERVQYIIAHHHTYIDVDGIDYQIIIEADFLVNRDEANVSHEAFVNFYYKHFKTQAGKEIARHIFGVEQAI
jgi:predicted metal-dependent HD superfamily phosphohydrolase